MALSGGAMGTLLSAVGLTLGCGLGYWLGRQAGRSFAARRPGPDDPLISSLLERHGAVVLVVCRGVPVLAEASVIAAGVLGMAASRFFLATTLANIGVGAAYAVGVPCSDVGVAGASVHAMKGWPVSKSEAIRTKAGTTATPRALCTTSAS